MVPGRTKAEAVYRTINDEIGAACPSTILRTCPHACLYLDSDSAAEILNGERDDNRNAG